MLAKAMAFPFGDHRPRVSSPVLAVRFCSPVPSALITKRSSPSSLPKESFPPGLVYRMRRPSGDQRGFCLLSEPKVSWMGSVPSGFIVQSCRKRLSARSLMKTILPPPPRGGAGVGEGLGTGVGRGSGVAVGGGAAGGGGGGGLVVAEDR